MNQPTKDVLREQLVLAADEIIRLREVCVAARDVLDAVRELMEDMKAAPVRWWHRFAWWRA